MELITVLIPVYNTNEEWLRLSIESILNQSYKHLEIIIVTDGPTDKSCSVVEEYAAIDKRIRVIHNKQNEGLVKTLNKGILNSKGKYIARMDSDDISELDRIEIQKRTLEQGNFDLIGGRIQKIDGKNNNIGLPTMSYSEKQVNRAISHIDCIPHPTWFAKRTVFQELSGYREVKFCEDYDFLLRAYSKGYRLGMCNQIVLQYRINTNGVTRTNSLRQYLSAKYLKNNLSRIDRISQSDIEMYLERKINDEESIRFEKSISYFREGVTLIKNRKYIYSIKSFIQGLTKSKYAIDNLANILLIHYILQKD